MSGDQLVMAGGGHTHALVLRRWAMRPKLRPKGLITLVTRNSTSLYSGMVPGLVAGYYKLEETLINLRSLTDLACVSLIIDEIVGIDLTLGCLLLEQHPPISFDTLSLDVGSQTLNDSFSNDYMSNNDKRLWVKYVHGSILESLNKSNYETGFDIVINSSIPMGKGISSSAALEISIVLSINKMFNLKMNNNDIIKKCQSVDHNHINIQSGVLDQSACLLSKKKSIFTIDFYNMNIEYLKYNLKNIKWILIEKKTSSIKLI